MKKIVFCCFFLFLLTSCVQNQQEENKIIENDTEIEIRETIYSVNPDSESEYAVYNAVMYQGTVYYGVLRDVKKLESSLEQPEYPENAVLLGKTAVGSAYEYLYYTHTPVPEKELQTNWTSPDEEIYAIFNEEGNPVEFYSVRMDETLAEGAEFKLVFLTTEKPDYYDIS